MSSRTCFVIGEGTLAIQAAEMLLERGHRVLGVVTREPAIERWADGRGIPRISPRDDVVRFLKREPFDYLFSVVNLTMLPDEVLSLPREMGINFHDSYLPRYAGVNATTWALLAGEKSHGVSWHEMKGEADTGRILVQQEVPIEEGETAFSLNAKCYTAGLETFEQLADQLTAGTLKLVEQDLSKRTYFDFYQRPEAACALRFDRPAEDVARTVAALDYGSGYPNPIGVAKLVTGRGAVLVDEAEASVPGSGKPAGTVVKADAEGLVVAAVGGDVEIRRVRHLCGTPLTVAGLVGNHGLSVGSTLPPPDVDYEKRLTDVNNDAARAEGFWLRRLEQLSAMPLPFVGTGATGGASLGSVDLTLPLGAFSGRGDLVGEELPLAVHAAFFARLSGESRFDLGYTDGALQAHVRGVEGLFARRVPLALDVETDLGFDAVAAHVKKRLASTRDKKTYARDLIARQPGLQTLTLHDGQPAYGVSIHVSKDPAQVDRDPDAGLTVVLGTDGKTVRWLFDPATTGADTVRGAAEQLKSLLERWAENPNKKLKELPLVTAADEKKILEDFNDTARPFPADKCVHQLFEEQAKKTPSAPAVSFRERTLTYAELDRRANGLAHRLVELGVGPDSLVGVYLERSEELLVATLAIQKAGGAYVPLDPDYPRDRIAFMVEDARMPVIVTQQRLKVHVPGDASVLCVDDERIGPEAEPPRSGVRAEHLAYVIYTSGSTGKPKGVMVEHRNVVNFFVGMDDRLGFVPGETKPGAWLAVTSLNFDISVLELFWTLSRGFHVVIYADVGKAAAEAAGFKHAHKPIDMSAFYFSSDASEFETDKYRLLIEGAKFADAHGFNAVWTPERHFHAFGGLYPNPSVTSAAVAMITKKVRLMSGSCVSPLHSPIRIAEEWSVVDNLSGGRVAISFAAGWQPNDFVIRTDHYEDRRDQMFRDIEIVKKLWRGETVVFQDPQGKDVEVRTLPRPIQKELPVWVTVAGNPETFRQAGEIGANILTHLLGQSIDDVREKVEVYRKARKDAGHEGEGVVSLMLHTFIGHDDAWVKEHVREPMKGYLRSAVGLVKAAAWSFPTFQKRAAEDGSFTADDLTEEENEALLDHAFERYYNGSSLFGSIETAVKFVDEVKGTGCDEIACLIDFGVPTDLVLESFPALAEVLERSNRVARAYVRGSEDGHDYGVPALIARHGITHLQCTPSMASMLVIDERTRESLKGLHRMMVGGEAFPVALARQLSELVGGKVINMYGPTETTIWSSTWDVKGVADVVPIGTPIANTDILLLDANQQLVPVGAAGELCIGGAGVVRGYWARPELTAERFLKHPWRSGQRLYRTGDLARFRDDGVVEFLGRLDHQVKIRGYRMELGEIETLLAEHPDVREAVVIAREDVPGDKRLVGYVIREDRTDEAFDPAVLSAHLGAKLPEYMVPSAFVTLTVWPQTPNRKIDRKALPAPEKAAPSRKVEFVQPDSAVEETIAGIWQEVLGVPKVGVEDNFFDLGGHSLLTVQVLNKLKPKVDKPLSLVDLFRYPTIRSLADYLGDDGEAGEALAMSAARGEARKARRNALRGRRGRSRA